MMKTAPENLPVTKLPDAPWDTEVREYWTYHTNNGRELKSPLTISAELLRLKLLLVGEGEPGL